MKHNRSITDLSHQRSVKSALFRAMNIMAAPLCAVLPIHSAKRPKDLLSSGLAQDLLLVTY